MNQLTAADSSEATSLNAKNRDLKPSGEDKIIVHELQTGDILEDNKFVTILEDTGGGQNLSC